MFATIICLIVYLRYSTAILTFPVDLSLRVLTDLLQLIFLIGVVAAFYIHPLSGSTRATKASNGPPERAAPSKLSYKGVNEIILALAVTSKTSQADEKDIPV